MNKINIISFPDKIYSDCVSLLIIYPSSQLQLELQKWLLSLENLSVNVYVYQESTFTEENFKWLLDVFSLADLVIVDIDHVPEYSKINQILSYIISKPKTYWLTNYQQSVYSYISNNKIYDLSFLSNIGVLDDKKQ